jgi:hypothetical protein
MSLQDKIFSLHLLQESKDNKHKEPLVGSFLFYIKCIKKIAS